MAFKTITLSDELPCRVRQLGLFEIDGKGREVLGPYKYTMLSATGQFIEDEYVMPQDQADIPIKPDVPKERVQPGTPEWDEMAAWETYQAALAWEAQRIESYEGFVGDICHYILNNCLTSEDRNRLTGPGDWDAVYSAAIVPQLTPEGVAACLRDTFYGNIQGSGDFRRDDAGSGRQRQSSSLEVVGV